jgi:hypothetical protein
MKAIFMAALLLVASSAHAIEKPAKVSEEVRVWTLANSVPVGKGLTVTDSQGCAWVVSEDNQVLKVMRPQNSDGTPICVKDPQAK